MESFASVCVTKSATGQLVGYMVHHYDGALGMLRVNNDHQRKGIAMAIIAQLTNNVIKASKTHVHVRVNSDVSHTLHYNEVCQYIWIFHEPND